MGASASFTTERLLIGPLQTTDAVFIQELVNTEGWLEFIGSRNVNSEAGAVVYIQKILANTNINYRVIRLKENNIPAGIITLIQRGYLPHRDIGFAFLPVYSKKGYAFEAAKAVLGAIVNEEKDPVILATTLASNKNSIQLLHKLGFRFDKEIEEEGEKIQVYALPANLPA
jgi:RimJ/RimL family protein N-acetyltransferase